MLCSRGTVGDHALTMIFAGGKQLQEIRRQGDRMINALAAVPDGEAAPAQSEPLPVESDSRASIAFVWMVADPALLLRRSVAEQLVFWLEVQLNALNWRVHRLDVHQDFIYLYADAPGRASPESLIRTVRDRSRNIACSEDKALPDNLWADAYLVLQPGRELSERELQNFLQFRPPLESGRLGQALGVPCCKSACDKIPASFILFANLAVIKRRARAHASARSPLSDRRSRTGLSQLFRAATRRIHDLVRREHRRRLRIQPHIARRGRTSSAEGTWRSPLTRV